MVSIYEINEWFMKEQDLVFHQLCEYLLYEIELNRNIHQCSIIFFFNLLCTFDRVFQRVILLM